METLFKVPPELQALILQRVPEPDLTRLFDLHRNEHPQDAYLSFRHLAIAAKFHGKHLVMSNSARHETFSVAQLLYLEKNAIRIAPLQISIVLDDFSNFAALSGYVEQMLQRFLPQLIQFTRIFNVELLLKENAPLSSRGLHLVLLPFHQTEARILCFSVKYQPGAGPTQNSMRMNFEVGALEHFVFEKLKLHLFSLANLLKHLAQDAECLFCGHLRTLDLLFNTLDDSHLQRLRIPPLVEHLNLSNNSICNFSNETFRFRDLKQLKTLDLSNNNLMSVEIRTQDHFQLTELNLSGNFLKELNLSGGFFAGLQSVNVAHNLLDKIGALPPVLRVLDLTGVSRGIPGAEICSA